MADNKDPLTKEERDAVLAVCPNLAGTMGVVPPAAVKAFARLLVRELAAGDDGDQE